MLTMMTVTAEATECLPGAVIGLSTYFPKVGRETVTDALSLGERNTQLLDQNESEEFGREGRRWNSHK